jgi:hypothetical protein
MVPRLISGSILMRTLEPICQIRAPAENYDPAVSEDEAMGWEIVALNDEMKAAERHGRGADRGPSSLA